MNNTIYSFKSDSEFFRDEQSGLKNNTARQIDISDERFQELLKDWKSQNYGFIRISMAEMSGQGFHLATEKEPDKDYSFVRKIRHIAVYKNLMIITWEFILPL